MSKCLCALMLGLARVVSAAYSSPVLGPASYWYSGDELKEPTALESQSGTLNVTLTVKPYRYTGFINFTTRCYHYDGLPLMPGPTWKIKQGDEVHVTLINELSDEGNTDTMTDSMFYGPNTTNLHTHGLHIDPAIDTVLIHVSPGESWIYNYTILSDHAPGLHWYHNHKHGSSAMQLMGGLYGGIYVEPSNANDIPAALQAYTRVLLIFSHFSTASANPTDDPFMVRTYETLSTLTGNTLSINPEYTNSSYKDIYFTNGQFQPYYSMTTGEGVVFDMLNAVGDHVLEIELRTGLNGTGSTSSCSMYVIALDGVYLNATRAVTYVVMYPAQRTSIIVTCNTAGTYYLQSFPDLSTRYGLSDTETRFSQNLLTLVVAGTASTSTSLPDLSTIPRPGYLSDLQNVSPDAYWEIRYESLYSHVLSSLHVRMVHVIAKY